MDGDHNSRIGNLKRELFLLGQSEQRLLWLISSEFTIEKLKIQAQDDLNLVLKRIGKATATEYLNRLEKEQ